MAKMLDYSGFRPSAAQLGSMKAGGVVGVLRYLCPPIPACDWKRITRAEAHLILDAGLDLVLNWEWYEGRCLEGAAAGTQDGTQALAAARLIGYPRGATIYVSHDTSARNDQRVLAYLRAFQLALRGYYRLDVYSGLAVVEMAINAGLARYGWQTVAWSYGQLGRAHLYQNGNRWFGDRCDENVVRARPLGSWRETVASPHPTPHPTPDPTPHPTPGPQHTPVHVYDVQAGDTLSKIAIRYHTTVRELVRLNRWHHPTLARNPALIRIGWNLIVPGQVAPHRPAPAQFYTVHAGDSLSSIAQHFHTSVNALVRWNKATYRSLATNPNLIQQGWHLRVAA